MNTPLAQIIALTCHGNAVIVGARHFKFFPGNSTCQFCDSIKFAQPKRSLFGQMREDVVSETPDDWFIRLKDLHATGLRLMWKSQNGSWLSDRMSAGLVGGGGDWKIEVLLSDGTSEFWAARWEVWNQNAPDRKIWRVTYALIESKKTKPIASRALREVKADFQTALSVILAFAEQQGCRSFADCFAKGLEALSDPGADVGYHKDLFVPGALPDDAASILKAAMSAYVFGGMGSWNDLAFEGDAQKEYERVSDQLFRTLNEAVAVAASSSCAQKR